MSLKRLVIVGAGAFGRELLGWARAIPASERDWEPAGFLDTNPDALEGFPCDLSVLGDEKTYELKGDELFACGLTQPDIKLKVCRALQARGATFVSVIHPRAIIGPHCRIGVGCAICPNVVLTNNVLVGNFVTINLSVGVGHDTVIADGCTINPGVQVGGKAILDEGVFVGSMAAVLERLRVGSYARIGSGSVVISRVPDRWTVMGVPARRLRLHGSA
ncbi:MAG TPA: acetyltransferase [Candidatus Obscuribacterales bacterium]